MRGDAGTAKTRKGEGGNGRSRLARGINGLAYRVARLWFRGMFYGHSLRGPVPHVLLFIPEDAETGDPKEGTEILEGRARFLNAGGEAPGHGPARQRHAQLARYHGFDWLRDLRAVDSDEALEKSARLIEEWMHRNPAWRPVSWRPDILSKRICNWLQHAPVLRADRDNDYTSHFLDCLARQIRHLRRVRRFVDHDLERLAVYKALTYAALALPGAVQEVPELLRKVLQTGNMQFFADGGHVSRNPEIQLEALRLLVDVRDAVRDAGLQVPAALDSLVLRVAGMTEFFRHGDGGLAQFNGAGEGDPARAEALLARMSGPVPRFSSARSSGFERIRTDRSLLIVDCGMPSVGLPGTLAFELSVDRQRIVVNCGIADHASEDWRQSLRTTAACSTLVVEDSNSSVVRRDGTLANGPRSVSSKRYDDDGQALLEMSHDGYARRHGLTHHRRLYVRSPGTLLRGEDKLVGKGDRRFDIRFHLHPTVKASEIRGGTSVLLRLPSRSGWRMRCKGGNASIEPSVYVTRPDSLRRTEQIVITGETRNGQAEVVWEFAELT